MAGAAGPGHTRILAGLLLGAAAGVAVNAAAAAAPDRTAAVAWVVTNLTRPVGDVFINLLFLAIIPLVFASVAVGVTKLGGGGNVGRVGAKTVLYFVITTVLAAVIGLTLVNLIRPGDQLPEERKEQLERWLHERLDGAHRPKDVIVVESLPRTPTGKIDGTRLRELAG